MTNRRRPTYYNDPQLVEAVARRAANLRRLRKVHKISAPRLAQRVGMYHSYFYEVENGRLALATLRMLDQIARAFGMTSSALLAELDAPLDPQAEAILKQEAIACLSF